MAIHIREEKVDLYNGQETLTLLHLSDIHVWFSAGVLDKLKSIIVQCNPQLLVFTGDYFDVPYGAYLFRDFIQEISLTYTTVFIRGNHDFVYGTRIANLLLHIPNCYCVEEEVYTFISPKGNAYHITSWQQRHLLQHQTGGKKIILIHNPEKLKENELEDIDLVFAGHLHGGQFIFCQTQSQGHFPGSLLYRYCRDRKQVNDTTVIVSKGIGDTFPLRLNCPKEVVRLMIR